MEHISSTGKKKEKKHTHNPSQPGKAPMLQKHSKVS